jgi:predicted HAD superfamily Cof-like phosphohydrolase
MNESPARACIKWRKAFGKAVADSPTLDVDPDQRAQEVRMILEESQEAIDAIARGGLVEIAHELSDVVIVAYGVAAFYGIDLDRVLDEVHRANMSKLGADGRPIYRDDGKVLKGPGYQPPDIAAALEAQVALSGPVPRPRSVYCYPGCAHDELVGMPR